LDGDLIKAALEKTRQPTKNETKMKYHLILNNSATSPIPQQDCRTAGVSN
jgi:hypothetical protein